MSTIRVNNMTNVGGDGPTYAKGSVIQVVNGVTNTSITSSSTSYVDTTLQATITPKSTSSKILVVVNHSGVFKGNGNAYNAVHLQLLRNSTVLTNTYNTQNTYVAMNIGGMNIGVNWLDTPATTSAVTYKTMFANNVASADIAVQHNNSYSFITLMEIAG